MGEEKDSGRAMTNDKPVKNRTEKLGERRRRREAKQRQSERKARDRAGSRRIRRTHLMLFKLCGLPAR